jgi:membrane protein implicated in regulation of membrane protease activity
MSLSTQWWVVCGLLVAAELATGTFYLLMLALGAAAAALAAMLGFDATVQLLVGAVVGGGAVALWHAKRVKADTRAPANANPDVNIDIGQQVQVDQWQDDGSAIVRYRGAEWRARFAGQGQPVAGKFTIRAIEGSCLQLDN